MQPGRGPKRIHRFAIIELPQSGQNSTAPSRIILIGGGRGGWRILLRPAARLAGYDVVAAVEHAERDRLLELVAPGTLRDLRPAPRAALDHRGRDRVDPAALEADRPAAAVGADRRNDVWPV